MNADLLLSRRRPGPGRRRFLALAAAALALPAGLRLGAASAQGFAGLGSGGGGFALPDRASRMRFPADHLPHPEFRIEWWYITANLEDDLGNPWGIQWTLFRSALDAADPGQQVWMGHAALTSAGLHLTAERLARSGQAGVTDADAGPEAFIDEWRMVGDPANGLEISASSPEFAFRLAGPATGPLVLHGQHGYSVKSPEGTASHYFSQPFLELSGTATTTDGPVRLRGRGWLDREWSSEPLSADQSGWDWFSLGLAGGARLMAFTVRGARPFRTATWIGADGAAQALPSDAVRTTPLRHADLSGAGGGSRVPVAHRIEIPTRGLDVTVEALRDDCWMPMLFPYWEGPVTVSGSHQGRGYLEMTGYD